jgi:hypothetical protein
MDAQAATIILKTEDMSSTVDWYRRVGFEQRGAFPDDDPTWCELRRDDLILQFLAGDTPWDGPPALTGCLYVHPPSVDKVYEEVKDRVTCAWGVEDREWGARELTLQDPNGYFITFSEASPGQPGSGES